MTVSQVSASDNCAEPLPFKILLVREFAVITREIFERICRCVCLNTCMKRSEENLQYFSLEAQNFGFCARVLPGTLSDGFIRETKLSPPHILEWIDLSLSLSLKLKERKEITTFPCVVLPEVFTSQLLSLTFLGGCL